MNYPYTAPLILTDSIFTAYGGLPENSLPTQRQAAYLMAEIAASEDLNTYLAPTIVTGTYQYSPFRPLVLDHTYIREIYTTRFIDTEGDAYYSIAGTNNIYVSIRNQERGIIDLDYWINQCGCSIPYQIEIAYQTGFASGTSYRPDILMALTTYADIILHEILGFGNESAGDIGVQEFESQEYREKRTALMRTTFGTSARAQFVHRVLMNFRRHQHVGL